MINIFSQLAVSLDNMQVPDGFGETPAIFNIMAIIVPVFIVIVFILMILMFIPKFRAKILGLQIKTMKHVVKNNEDDLTEIGSRLGGVSANIAKNVVDQNEDTLKHTATKSAKISEEGVEITAGAIKRGFEGKKDSKSNKKCEKCDSSVDKDSSFCKECGTKL